MILAIDWDDTLVKGGEWLPGAVESLRRLSRRETVYIHSCRANWPEGLKQIEQKLESARLDLNVWTSEGKPFADVYIDDKGLRFEQDWTAIERRLYARG